MPKRKTIVIVSLLLLECAIAYAYSYLFLLAGSTATVEGTWLEAAAWMCIAMLVIVPLIVVGLLLLERSDGI